MKYHHSFIVRSPLAQVVAFHARPDGMRVLTPPPIVVRVHRAAATIAEGEEMDFTLWLGPLPARWQARFSDVSSNGFTDQQVRGPFEMWIHRHSFNTLDAQHTQVEDHIEARLRRHLLWLPVGLAMWAGMPFLFAYRTVRTRRVLEQRS